MGGIYVAMALLINSSSNIVPMRSYYQQLMTNYSIPEDHHSKQLVDGLQTFMYCCGDLGPNDWHNKTLLHNSTNLMPVDQYPLSCCGKSSYDPNMTTCDTSELRYHSGCFSSAQMSRYNYYLHVYFIALIGAILLLLAISCCLERDHQLQQSKLVNMQYSAHLETCRGGRRSAMMVPTAPPQPSFMPSSAAAGSRAVPQRLRSYGGQNPAGH